MPEIHFYNVGENRVHFRKTTTDLSDDALLYALLSGVKDANHNLSFHIDDDGKNGQVILRPGRVVALFEIRHPPQGHATRTANP